MDIQPGAPTEPSVLHRMLSETADSIPSSDEVGSSPSSVTGSNRGAVSSGSRQRSTSAEAANPLISAQTAPIAIGHAHQAQLEFEQAVDAAEDSLFEPFGLVPSTRMSGTGRIDVKTERGTSAMRMSLTYRPVVGPVQIIAILVSDTYWNGDFGMRFTTIAVKNAFKSAYRYDQMIPVSVNHGPLAATMVAQPAGGQQPHTEVE